MDLKMNSHQVNHSNTTEMDQYSEYLMSSYPNQFMPMIKFSEQYETFLVYYQKKGYKLDELFLKCIRDNNMLMFRRMIMDPRVNLSYQNNEALKLRIIGQCQGQGQYADESDGEKTDIDDVD